MFLKEIQIENIRGFSYTTFNLESKDVVFVGPNNSGKTSILLLLNWFFNELTTEYLHSGLDMPTEWKSILLPARETRNRARRITLKVDISDGRKRRKYPYSNGDDFVVLRLSTRMTSPKVVARIGYPLQSEPFESDHTAIDLIEELQDKFAYKYISPFRGHSPAGMMSHFSAAFSNEINDWYRSLGASSNTKRAIKKQARVLEETANDVLVPLIETIVGVLPAGIAPNTKLEPNISAESLMELIANNAKLNLSTGSHDEAFVSPSKVGSGLRSLLELAVQAETRDDRQTIIAIEEPEAFLHPIAQRILAKELYSLVVEQRIISTHSPIFVEESDLQGVVLVRDHKFYPSHISDEVRQEINLALLKKHGAELLFARSVLFVEGESDYFFFESLKERLLKADNEGVLLGLYVIPVGGKQQFCPYAQLLDGFSNDEKPIDWLIVADADASIEVRKIANTLGIELPSSVNENISNVTSDLNDGNISSWLRRTISLNNSFENNNINIQLAPGDLEYMILEKAGDDLFDELKLKLRMDDNATKEDVIKKLGSKGVDGVVSNNAVKSPYLRAFIGKNINSYEFSRSLRKILEQWVKPLGVSRSKIAGIAKKINV